MTYEISSPLESSLLKQPARVIVLSLISPVALAKCLPESAHENPDLLPESIDVATDNLSAETLAKGSRAAEEIPLGVGPLIKKKMWPSAVTITSSGDACL
jgi:hypothetical protein